MLLRITLVTLAMLSGLTVSSLAYAGSNDLDITINVVGPHQDIQGTIENHIKIPTNHAHQIINQANDAGTESHNHEHPSISDQSNEASQQSQEQQQVQQDAQNATEQNHPDN